MNHYRATLRLKNQMTLPEKIRMQAGVNAGDIFEIDVREGQIVLTPRRLTALR
jgi:AbrB family looped-hinge helix DNA binding protein